MIPAQIADDYAAQGFATCTPEAAEFGRLVDAAAADADGIFGAGDDAAHASFQSEDGAYYHVSYPHIRFPAIRALIRSPEVAEIVSSLYPSEPVYVTHSKFSYRQLGADQAWLPHQDSGYKSADCRGTTFCIHLEDIDVPNGALQLFPGSHRLGRLHHVTQTRPGDAAPQTWIPDMPEIEPEYIVGKKGTLMAFSLDMIHQSAPNRSHGNRKILIFEVEPVETTYNDEHGRLSIVLNGRPSADIRMRSAVRALATLPLRALRRSSLFVRLVRAIRSGHAG